MTIATNNDSTVEARSWRYLKTSLLCVQHCLWNIPAGLGVCFYVTSPLREEIKKKVILTWNWISRWTSHLLFSWNFWTSSKVSTTTVKTHLLNILPKTIFFKHLETLLCLLSKTLRTTHCWSLMKKFYFSDCGTDILYIGTLSTQGFSSSENALDCLWRRDGFLEG